MKVTVFPLESHIRQVLILCVMVWFLIAQWSEAKPLFPSPATHSCELVEMKVTCRSPAPEMFRVLAEHYIKTANRHVLFSHVGPQRQRARPTWRIIFALLSNSPSDLSPQAL